jgi:hypothetical protein
MRNVYVRHSPSGIKLRLREAFILIKKSRLVFRRQKRSPEGRKNEDEAISKVNKRLNCERRNVHEGNKSVVFAQRRYHVTSENFLSQNFKLLPALSDTNCIVGHDDNFNK